jgi:hypothetical protein
MLEQDSWLPQGTKLVSSIHHAQKPLDVVSADQLAAFAGLTPQEFSSGSSVHGKTRLPKIVNSHLRNALYMPAIVARRYNPFIHAFCDRLLTKGNTNSRKSGNTFVN